MLAKHQYTFNFVKYSYVLVAPISEKANIKKKKKISKRGSQQHNVSMDSLSYVKFYLKKPNKQTN